MPLDSLRFMPTLYPSGFIQLITQFFSRSKPTMSVSILSGICAPRDFSFTFNLCFTTNKKETFSSYLVNFADVVEFGKLRRTYDGLHEYCMSKHRLFKT
jgi:hypothetical protein